MASSFLPRFCNIGFFLALLITTPAYADVDVGGSIRLRFEDKIDFNLQDSGQDYFLSQVRAHIDWKPAASYQFFLELQDARVFGEELTGFPPINKNARNQPFHDELDVHRAFFKWQSGDMAIKVGRQKFNLGDQRLVASLEWVNTARVHDGISFTKGNADSRTVDLFASRLVSVSPDELNNQGFGNDRYFDSEFHGLFVTDKATLPGSQLEYWYFYRRQSDYNDSIHTLGGRLTKTLESWSLDLQGALQTGEYDGLDHSAHMIHAGASRPLGKGTFGIAYNMASGDDDPTDRDHQTFDNLYPLNHAYYGYMDLFSLQNMHNLELTYVVKPWTATTVRVAYQGVWLAETNDAWYNAGLAGNGPRLANSLTADSLGQHVDSHVGSEIDLTISYSATKQWNISAGLSRFFPGGYAADTGANGQADFIYVMTNFSF